MESDNRHFTIGMKHDQEKPALQYLSAIWVNDVGRVLSFGAKKYAGHNWRKGIHQSRLLAACLRHVFAFMSGEDNDPETGLSHLSHASCCLMFAHELHKTKPEFDDRYKVSEMLSFGEDEFPPPWGSGKTE